MNKKRVGIIGFLHESNTFTSEKTELRHFEEAFYHHGDAITDTWRDAHHELGGFIEGCNIELLDIVPLVAASATPKGPVTDEAYETILSGILKSIQNTAPLDGVLVALHGAMVTESLDSADSETLRRIRSAIGDACPLILSLDMHANVTHDMIRIPDATIIYRTYPHIDQRDRGIECARLMARMLRGEVNPVQACVKIPMLIHIVRQYTGDGAMHAAMNEIESTAAAEGMISASLAPGYIYADVPHMGVSVVAISDGGIARAESEAKRLADRVYGLRHELNADLPSVEEGVREAAAIDGAVCLMDAGDNIGGGGPGDSTIVFHEIVKQGIPNACVILFDPAAAKECAQAGEGAEIELDVGGKTDDRHGAPVHVQGAVGAIHDGHFTETEARHGGARNFDQGLTAVIETHDGHTIIVNSLRVMPVSIEQLHSLGIDPTAMNIIIVKGVTAPRAAYDPIAAATIPIDSPGHTQAGPEAFVYKNRPRPLYPLDPEEPWSPIVWH